MDKGRANKDRDKICSRHGKPYQLDCDNLHCNNFLCSDCWSYSDEYVNMMPSAIHYYCFECIDNKRAEQYNLPTSDNFYSSEERTVNTHTKTVTVEKESSKFDEVNDAKKVSCNDTYDDVKKKLFQSDEEESVSTTLMTQPTDNYQSKGDKKSKIVPKEVLTGDIDADSDVVNSDSSCGHLSDGDSIEYENCHQIYIPDWYEEVMTSSEDKEAIEKDLKQRCWVTDDLSTEIRNHYPTSDEIIVNRSIGNCTRDMTAFQKKCAAVFPTGRIFMSYKQVQQAAKHFLTGWNCKKSGGGMFVSCFYSKRQGTSSYKSSCEPAKRRSIQPSLKEQFQCPFIIRYTFHPNDRDTTLPNIFHKVRITTCNYEHTCELSSIFFKTANRMSRGKVKINLKAMTSVLMLLKANPTTSANSLRPLLLEYVHHDIPLDCVFLRNFRQRVALFHAQNPEFTDLSLSDAHSLLDKSPITKEEQSVLDNPIVRIKFNDMLLKVMREGSSTWEALEFLQRCKKEMPGFDFRIRLNKANHPCSLVFTTVNGRLNSIKYGDVISIDMQHRQHNDQNWPYFAPVIKDMNMNIGVICEALVLSEDLEAYAWVFKKMVEMEPRFDLKKIRIIFADQGVTTSLLECLGIADTCVLRGDYYHLMREVWPQSHNFGILLMEQIGPFLSKMLLSDRKDDFEQCYINATNYVKNDPEKLAKLDVIKDNPSYYAGYYIRQITGNLEIKGDVSSEQNHASVVAHLGESGGGWSIMAHICELIKRQAEHQKQMKKKDDELHCSYTGYVSKHSGRRGTDDIEAKKSLSVYAYKRLYSRAANYAYFLTSVIEADGSVSIWKAEKKKDDTKVWTIFPGSRCKCQIRIDYDFQCGHELVADGRFIVDKYNKRWLNNYFYYVKYPENSPFNISFILLQVNMIMLRQNLCQLLATKVM